MSRRFSSLRPPPHPHPHPPPTPHLPPQPTAHTLTHTPQPACTQGLAALRPAPYTPPPLLRVGSPSLPPPAPHAHAASSCWRRSTTWNTTACSGARGPTDGAPAAAAPRFSPAAAHVRGSPSARPPAPCSGWPHFPQLVRLCCTTRALLPALQFPSPSMRAPALPPARSASRAPPPPHTHTHTHTHTTPHTHTTTPPPTTTTTTTTTTSLPCRPTAPLPAGMSAWAPSTRGTPPGWSPHHSPSACSATQTTTCVALGPTRWAAGRRRRRPWGWRLAHWCGGLCARVCRVCVSGGRGGRGGFLDEDQRAAR
jgi:hypothetical protein